MPGASVKPEHATLGPIIGFVAALACLLAICPAVDAAPPSHLIKLRDSDRSAQRADDFEAPSKFARGAARLETTPAHQHEALIGEVVSRPLPSLVESTEDAFGLQPPQLVLGRAQRDTGRHTLGLELAGTGASIFTGALLVHLETLELQSEFDTLSANTNPRRFRELRNRIDQTRKIVVTLYAVGGSMLTGGVVLLTSDERDGVQAKLGPAWMNGGPAARLKISF